MIDRRTAVVIALVGVSLMFAAVAASAAGFGDGEYALDLPGVGDFEFLVDSERGDAVQPIDAPFGYEVADGATDILSWTSERPAPEPVPKVEIKPDKIKAEVYWAKGPVRLSMPGGWIKITEPRANGAFTVETGGSWWPFGRGANWYVADDENIRLARAFFMVKANAKEVEIQAVKSVDRELLETLEGSEDQPGKPAKDKPSPARGKPENPGNSAGQGRG